MPGAAATILAGAAAGDSRERRPEHPDGIGRLWTEPNLSAALADYVSLVREFDEAKVAAGLRAASSAAGAALRRPEVGGLTYAITRALPGCCAGSAGSRTGWRSGRSTRRNARPCDRELAAGAARVHPPSGWFRRPARPAAAARERGALVLIDPPYEAQAEWRLVAAALRDGLRRVSEWGVRPMVSPDGAGPVRGPLRGNPLAGSCRRRWSSNSPSIRARPG